MLKTVLILLTVFVLQACAPIMTYEEVEEEAIRTGDHTKLEKYEKRIKKAYAHLHNKTNCKEYGLIWACSAGPGAKERNRRKRNGPITVAEVLTIYREDRFARCGCVTQEQMREMLRRLFGRY